MRTNRAAVLTAVVVVMMAAVPLRAERADLSGLQLIAAVKHGDGGAVRALLKPGVE